MEALSATGNFTQSTSADLQGLRSIRYAKEIEGVKNIIANDIDAAAVEAIQRNIDYNQVEAGKITPNHADARSLLVQLS